MKKSLICILAFLIPAFLSVSAQEEARPGDLNLMAYKAVQTEEQARSAQQKDKAVLNLFVGIGVSSSFENKEEGSTLSLIGFSIQADYFLFSFRRTYSSNIFINNEAYRDLGLLLGILAPIENNHLSLSIGFGQMTKIKADIFGNTSHLGSAYGFPLALQYYMPTGKSISGGVYALANFNELQSFWGISINVNFILTEIFRKK